ncbi:MAG: anti-sigma factor domain-containing protein [Acidimicrobiales bacterium]
MGGLTQPTHEELQELLGAYALDAVDAEEGAMVEAHLALCPRCREEVTAHRELAGLFAYAGQGAPEDIWDHLATELSSGPPPLRLVAEGQSRRTHFVRVRTVIAVAAVAAAAIAGLGFEVDHLNSRVSTLSNNLASPAPGMSQVHAALAVPGAQPVALSSPNGGAVLAQAVVDPDGMGYIYGVLLNSLPAQRTYQLWGVEGTTEISFGLLGAAPSVVAFRSSGAPGALAITDEVAGGVVQTHNTPQAVGTLSN